MNRSRALLDDISRAGINGDVIGPNHAEYDARRRVWNGAFDRFPLVIVRPVDAEDVQRTVEVVANADVPLAVRGGGHSLAGFSTCDDGIVIDLSRLNTAVVDRTQALVRVGGGALLHDLDTACVAEGVVVSAGVVSHTGVAGLTLGGGMGWNSRRYGLAIDSLRRVQLVTADGRVLTVDADSDAELFWALRGGGGNFGVVTRFEFGVRDLGKPSVLTAEYPTSSAFGVLRELAKFALELPRDQTVGLFINPQELTVKSIWFGDPGEAYQRLSTIAHLDATVTTSTESTFVELQQASDEGTAWGIRCYSKGGFLPQLDDDFISLLLERLSVAPTEDCDVYMIQLGGAVGDVEEDATAYSGRAAAFYYVISAVWAEEASRDAAIDWGRETAALFGAQSMATNYVNEQSDSGSDFVRRAYGETKYARLVEVKRRLDPTNLFRLNQNIAP